MQGRRRCQVKEVREVAMHARILDTDVRVAEGTSRVFVPPCMGAAKTIDVEEVADTTRNEHCSQLG